MGISLVGKSMSARGRAGPLDPNGVAKFSTAVVGLRGGLGYFIPKKIIEEYGWNSTSPIAEWVTRRYSTNMLSNSLIAWCSIFQEDMKVNKAIAVGFIPWIVTLGNEDHTPI